jgi:hypothetical protein
MNLVALTFARAAGVEPHLDNWPHMRRALLFGPLAPSCFRLDGPDALSDAPVRFERDGAAFGAITSNELTERESRYWSLVETATSGSAKGDGAIFTASKPTFDDSRRYLVAPI